MAKLNNQDIASPSVQLRKEADAHRKTTSKTFELSHSPRKRPHPNDSEHIEAELAEDDQCAQSSPKRPRTAEWPLKNGVDINTSANEDNVPSSSHKKRHDKRTRPSRFKEGSLNDKPSKQPPASYLEEGDPLEKYANGEDTKNAMHKVEKTGPDTAKPAGLFRFGKAIAAALNPVNFWQGLGGTKKEKEYATDSEKDQSEIYKEEVNKAYTALKEGGFEGMKRTITRQSIDVEPTANFEDMQDACRNSFHDSAIDVEAPSIPNSRDNSKSMLGSNTSNSRDRSKSPMSVASSGRRSFTQLRPPSLRDLKKVKSHLQLPTKRGRASKDSMIPSIDSVLADDVNGSQVELRRRPSKKDLARVQKLNKRVSDLELKLDTARHELQQSLQTPPAVPALPANVGRKHFVPGALATLPSERLLGQHAEYVRQRTLDKQDKEINTRRPRKSLDEKGSTFRKSWLDLSPEKGASTSSAKRNSSRRTSSRISSANISAAKEAPPTELEKASFELPSPPSHASIPCRDGEKGAPADPDLNASPDPLTKDAGHTPKGKRGSKTLHISTQHDPRARSPLPLAPTFAPMETRSKASRKRGISPPPPSLNSSAKKSKQSTNAADVKKTNVKTDSPLTARNANAEAPKGGSRARRSGLEGAEKWKDKPLPEIQREDWEWGEDVF